LSTTANVRLTLRALEAGENSDTLSLRDDHWWNATPLLDDVTSDALPQGPKDAYVSQAIIDDLVAWFRSLTHPPRPIDYGAVVLDREPSPDAYERFVSSSEMIVTEDVENSEGSSLPNVDRDVPNHADAYVELDLPEEWRPILEPYRRGHASPPQHEVWSPAVIEGLINEKLNDRLRFIVNERFVHGRTLEEVGRELGVTRERVRQLESQARKSLQHADSNRPFEDGDLRARISNVEDDPLLLAHDGRTEAALHCYLAWSKEVDVRISPMTTGLVVASPKLHDDRLRAERYVSEGYEFVGLSTLADALSMGEEMVRIIVELSESLYFTENEHVGSAKWSKPRQMEVAAWTLALSELEVLHWHASELLEGAKILFPESLNKWRAHNAFSTISTTAGGAFVHTGQRGTWALREAIAGPATTMAAVTAFLASEGSSDSSSIHTHLESLGRLVRRGTLEALLQREPVFVRTDEGRWMLRDYE